MPSVQFRPHSCNLCQRLVLQPKHQEATGENSWFRKDLISDKVIFDFTFRDLKASAAQGCKLCQWILNDEAISRSSFENSDPPGDDESAIDIGTYELLSSIFDNKVSAGRSSFLEAVQEAGDNAADYVLLAATSPPFKIGIGYMSDVLRIDYFGLWDAGSKTIPYRTRHGLQCFAEPGDAAAKEVSTRPIESDPAISLPQISSWLKECRSNHKKCWEMMSAMRNSTVRPQRLLFIDSSGPLPQIRLQDTQGLAEEPQYVALSYCWGGDQPIKTTKDVLAKFTVSIDFGTLPRTLQDSIRICKRLGYSYVWIDALCIVQNDDQEKVVEIAKMPYIYGHAAFTIGASRSSTVGSGFLQPRVPDSETRVAFALPCVCSNGEIGTLNFVDLDIDAEPIDSRGWTLQERLLSPRIVEFGTRQTRWTCQDAHFDGLVDGWRREAELSPLKPKMAVLWVALGQPGGPDVSLWNHLVEIYTERKLTQSDDRPLAISGIAEWLSSLTGDEYVAGLWKSRLHTGLLWSVEPKDRAMRAQLNQGPSWSWLSVNSSVWHHYSSPESESPENVKIKLLSSSIALKNKAAPYGAVRSGSTILSIQGKLARAHIDNLRTLRPDDDWISFNDHVVTISGRNDSGSSRGTADFFPDCEEQEWLVTGNDQDREKIMALEVQNYRDGPTWTSRGIVIRRVTDNPSTTVENIPKFARVGNYVFEVDTDNGQRDDESDDDWERRIDMELNWFKHVDTVTLDLV
ncbi:Fc.00g058210.m01.CDS01 [Cosmosporella sp. VM-42]